MGLTEHCCLERSGFDFENDILIKLGDVTDGYHQIYECVEMLLKIRQLIALKGNHDDWFADFIKIDLHPYFWNYGSKGTLISYLDHWVKMAVYSRREAGLNPHWSQRISHIHTKPFLTVSNSSILMESNGALFMQVLSVIYPLVSREKGFYWNRDLWTDALRCHTYFKNTTRLEDFFTAVDFNEIYIGHTPTTNWASDKPLRALNILNLDTGAGHKGRLTIMDIETKKYWQSDPLPELYPENFRQELFN